MPEVVHVPVNVYEYSELCEEAQEKARTDLGDSLTDIDWSDSTLDYFRDILQILGFVNATDIEFQYDLCGQGSGLSFTGDLEYSVKALKVIKERPHLTECIGLAEKLEELQAKQDDDQSISVSVRRKRGRRSVHHLSVDIDAYDSDGLYCEKLSDELEDHFQFVMQEFFFILRKEYEDYFSDGYILDYLIDNPTRFTADGSVFFE